MALEGLYRIEHYGSTDEAIRAARSCPPDVIIIDERTPPAGGWRLVEQLKSGRITRDIRIVYSAGADEIVKRYKDSKIQADTVLLRPYGRSSLVGAVSSLINNNIEEGWKNLPGRPRKALTETLGAFTGISETIKINTPLEYSCVSSSCEPLVEAVQNNEFRAILDGVRGHDNYSYSHSIRVATMLVLLAHNAAFSTSDQLILASGGLLHDAGKMLIPHEILNKPGRLDDHEREIMKSHVAATTSLLRASDKIPNGVMIIAEQHHEKIDGTGYPNGLKGSELNELARMAAIVDIFCALTDRRVYKEPMDADKALSTMTSEMSTHVDQYILRVFRHILLDIVVES